METLLHVACSNALVASLLALPAAAVSWSGRRPALAHGLWLLVLLKLVTPPIVFLPLPAFCTPQPESTAVLLLEPLVLPILDLQPLPEADEPSFTEEMVPPIEATATPAAVATVPTPAPEPIVAAPADPRWIGDHVPLLLALFWLAGSVAWLGLTSRRVRRFQRLLRHARPAPVDVEAQAQEAARQLGLSVCPRIRAVPGAVSPMLWGLFGRAELLLPADLLQRLDASQRAALLAHELAHLRRRDHWVRHLELLTTGLFWWHPVVWWARRELREAEEQCCDAWVVWALPGAAKAYALALIETVDFLTEARLALPPMASGVGQTSIQRRLTMIMHGTTPRSLSVAGLLAVLGLALLLPLVPTLAQAEPPDPPRPVREIRKEVEGFLSKKVDPAQQEEIEKLQRDLKKLSDELTRRLDENRALERKIEETARRLAELGGPAERFFQLRVAPPGVPGQPMPFNVPLPAFAIGAGTQEDLTVLAAQAKAREAQVEEAKVRLRFAQSKLDRLRKLAANGTVTNEAVEEATSEVAIHMTQLKAREAELEEVKARMDLARRRPTAGVRVDVPRSALPAMPPAPATTVRPPAPAADSDQRFKDVESKLHDLLRELEKMRQELRPGSRPAPAPPAPPGGEPQARNAPAEDLRGKIKSVDADTDLATVNLGSDVGLNKGNTLEVFRLKPRPTYVGTLRILEVRPTEAVGKLILKRADVQADDEVASKVIAEQPEASSPPAPRRR